jgi:hypothetical protein
MVANTDQRDLAKKTADLIACAFDLAYHGNRSEPQIDLVIAELKTFVLQTPHYVAEGPSRCTCSGVIPDGDDTCCKCGRVSETRQEKEDPIRLMMTLCGQATGLINEKKRSEAEMVRLAETLQLFKDLPSVKNQPVQQATSATASGETKKCVCGNPLNEGDEFCSACRSH